MQIEKSCFFFSSDHTKQKRLDLCASKANKDILVFLLAGVKNADENELRSIASEPDEGHVYNVADFSIMSSIVEGLTRIVCEQVELQDKDIKQSKT